MENIFLHMVNMSITAGWLVLAVVLFRLVFRRVPKWIHCLLWVLVAVRLVCPFSFESVLSLIPSAETVPVEDFLYDTPAIHSGVPVVDNVVNPIISSSFAPQPMNSVNPMQVLSTLAAYVWVLGMVMMVLYMAITTLRLWWRVRESVRLQRNIFQCDRIATPFILGVVRPRIYLPTTLSEGDILSVVAHEEAHIQRRDHWWKPLGFLLLTVYWFNPLLWLGYVLLCRDIEAACDQKVIKDMDVSQRKSYSSTLLACSAPRHLITACPLAFGETGVKSRIKAVLNYKKPAFWLIMVAVVAAVVAAVCLLTDPLSGGEKPVEEPTDGLEQRVELYSRFTWEYGYMDEETRAAVCAELGMQSGESTHPVMAITNKAELEKFIAILQANRANGSTKETDLIQKMRAAYTDEYFDKRMVLSVYYIDGSSSYKPEIVAAHISDDGGKATVMVDVYTPYIHNDAMGGWFMMADIDRSMVEAVTAYDATVRANIPDNYYVSSFENSRYMYQIKSVEYVREEWRSWLGEDDWDMEALVKALHWTSHSHKVQYSPYIGAINAAGETYYVNDKYDILSSKEKTAYLTADQSKFVRGLFNKSPDEKVGPVPYMEGNDPYKGEDKPYPAYTYLYGRYMEHNKGERYVILQVVHAENADLAGKKVVVSLKQLSGFGMPSKGTMIEIPYDGTVEKLDEFPKVKAQGFAACDGAAFVNFNDPGDIYDDEVGGKITGEVTQVTDNKMLVESYTDEVIWVNYAYAYPEMKPEVGDVYTITYADGIWQTTPPQVTADVIKAVSYASERENNFITEAKAVEIASEYWKVTSDDTKVVVVHIAPTFEDPIYSMTLRELIKLEDGTSQYNPVDGLHIHAVTGEIVKSDGSPTEAKKSSTTKVSTSTSTSSATEPTVTATTTTRGTTTTRNQSFISESRAIEIASEYWKITPGDRDPDTGYIMSIHAMETPTAENPCYRMALRWLVETEGGTSNFSTLDTIYVHAETEEIALPGDATASASFTGYPVYVPTDAPTTTVPTVVHGRIPSQKIALYFDGRDHVFEYKGAVQDEETGRWLWEYREPMGIHAPVCMVDAETGRVADLRQNVKLGINHVLTDSEVRSFFESRFAESGLPWSCFKKAEYTIHETGMGAPTATVVIQLNDAGDAITWGICKTAGTWLSRVQVELAEPGVYPDVLDDFYVFEPVE